MLSSNVPPKILSVLYTFVVSLTLFDVYIIWAKKNSVLAPTFFFTLSQGLLITTYLGIKNLVCSLKTNYQQALYVKRNLEAC